MRKRNISTKKKYTAFHQKEWVSGNVIFLQKEKICGTFELRDHLSFYNRKKTKMDIHIPNEVLEWFTLLKSLLSKKRKDQERTPLTPLMLVERLPMASHNIFAKIYRGAETIIYGR